jgi:hypothetical protein
MTFTIEQVYELLEVCKHRMPAGLKALTTPLACGAGSMALQQGRHPANGGNQWTVEADHLEGDSGTVRQE